MASKDVAFSRDGKWIAYVRLSDSTLWISHLDGSVRLQLTYPPVRAGLPRWSPDNKQLIFMRSQNGKPWKAVVISAQGGTSDELMPGETTEGDPSWSPDGTHIVFSTGLGGVSRQSDIRLMDSKTRQTMAIPGSAGLFSPRWSPDGRYLAALDLQALSQKIVIFDFKAQKWSDWVTDTAIAYPAWSSDSRSIRYDTDNECKQLRVGESRPEVVFSLKDLNIYFTDFGPWGDNTPDGSRMYLRDASTQDIYALDVDFP